MNRSSEVLRILLQPQAPGSFWVSNILSGVRGCAAHYGDVLTFPTLEALAATAVEAPVLVVGNNLDWLELTVRQLLASRIHPIVINACMIPGYHNRCSSVVFALEDAVTELRQHLHALGRQRTVMLGLSPHSAADRIKSDAFAAPGDVFWAKACVEDCVHDFVESGLSRYDSAICANDTAAICLSRALAARNLRVPEDFSIAGMGNSWLGSALSVPLTSIDFDYVKLGDQAVRLFHSILQNPEPCYESRALPCRLTIRASTGSAVSREGVMDPVTPAPARALDFDPVEGTLYYSGAEVQQILSLEAVLQSCKSSDREILFSLMRGMSCEQIAQNLFFTPRAIRYRVRRLTERFGLSQRSELIALLRHATQTEPKGRDLP